MNQLNRPELTYEEFCDKPLQYTMGVRYDWGAHRLHRNEELGIQKEVVTEQKVKGNIYSGWKPATVAFFIDGDDKLYDTPDQLYVAYMAKVCEVKPCCSPYCECSAGQCGHPGCFDDRDRR